LTKVSHTDDVLVTNRSRGARFTFKARDGFTILEIFVIENVRPNSFDCDLASNEVLVAREINLAHRAAA
jgi:hypothetical protein